MPEQTFFNLAEQKRQTIEKAAINEFNREGYLEASINKIIKDANISRGSFYSYFQDKNDLYQYLIDKLLVTSCHLKDNNLNQANFFDQQILIFEKLIKAGEQNRNFIQKFLTTSTINHTQYFWRELNNCIPIKQKQLQALRFQAPKDLNLLLTLRNVILWQALQNYFIDNYSYDTVKANILKQLLFLKIGIQK